MSRKEKKKEKKKQEKEEQREREREREICSVQHPPEEDCHSVRLKKSDIYLCVCV